MEKLHLRQEILPVVSDVLSAVTRFFSKCANQLPERFLPVNKMITAEVKLETDNPQRVLDSLKPDMDDANRFSVNASVSGKILVFKIEASDIAALKAALNSYLRLVQIAQGLEVKK